MGKDLIKDHIDLFTQPEYLEMFENKKKYEDPATAEEIEKTLEWTKSEEYKEKNFSRKALVINPMKACQPLGALFASMGFENSLPYIHGSQGCAAYFRSHFSRHFKEPCPAVCDSMTEDAAVFGGHNNMYVGTENAYKLYKPDIMPMFTTCMSEVIGDDLNSFIKNSKEKECIPEDLPVPHAHTPSFIGSHITGYDNMMLSLLSQMGEKTGTKTEKVNIIVGYDTYIENFREIKRICSLFGIDAAVISDASFAFDSPANGEFRMYQGGTSLEDLRNTPNAKATLFLQNYSVTKTIAYVKKEWEQDVYVVNPIGIEGTDALMEALSTISGNPVPEELEIERGRLVDAITDSYYWVYGKTFSLNADPDFAIGITRFVMELGGEIKHVVLTNGSKKWVKEIKSMLDDNILGEDAEVYRDKDMWHWRSLLFTDPSDYIIGSSYAKYLVRDTHIPLIRIGFPIFDRHHMHRYATMGYKGGLNLMNWVVNTILDEVDRKTMDTASYDLVR